MAGDDSKHNGLDAQVELEETQRSLREVTLMIEQSQAEMTKLTQRNGAITAHLQQTQKQIGELPPEEIRMAYDSALDAQQRLWTSSRTTNSILKNIKPLWKYSALPVAPHLRPAPQLRGRASYPG
jgi:two-component system sensor histidine kinase DegS